MSQHLQDRTATAAPASDHDGATSIVVAGVLPLSGRDWLVVVAPRTISIRPRSAPSTRAATKASTSTRAPTTSPRARRTSDFLVVDRCDGAPDCDDNALDPLDRSVVPFTWPLSLPTATRASRIRTKPRAPMRRKIGEPVHPHRRTFLGLRDGPPSGPPRARHARALRAWRAQRTRPAPAGAQRVERVEISTAFFTRPGAHCRDRRADGRRRLVLRARAPHSPIETMPGRDTRGHAGPHPLLPGGRHRRQPVRRALPTRHRTRSICSRQPPSATSATSTTEIRRWPYAGCATRTT